MGSPQLLEQLKRAYLSGRDPLAYIPYVSQLLEDRQYAQSMEVCLRGLAARPSIAGKRLLAQVMYETGRYQDALSLLREILQEAPQSFAAKILLAKTCLRCGQWTEAKDLLDALEQENPQDTEVQDLARQVREDLDRSEQVTPIDLDLGADSEQHKSKFCQHFMQQQGVGFCFFQRPEQGNVLEASSMETLFGLILEKSERITSALGLGACEEVMIEFDQGYVVSRRTGEDFLVAQFRRDVSPGQMRQTLSRYLG